MNSRNPQHINTPLTNQGHVERSEDDQDCQPYEEPLFLDPMDGYGYYPSARIGHLLQEYQPSATSETRLKEYIICRKLGWARGSSVWLCRDTAAPPNTFIAIKILSAHSTACVATGVTAELDVYLKVKSANPNHPGVRHCITIKRHIIARSSVGHHMCFVMDVLGSNMTTLRLAQPDSLFTLPIAKRLIKQTLLGLDYLHRECGYIHTDIKADNIVADLPSNPQPLIANLLREDPSATYEPQFNDALSSDPIVTVISQPLSTLRLGPSLSSLRVRVIDYGESTLVSKQQHGEHYQPEAMRAPEVILGHHWSTGIDIWSVGCLLFEWLTNHSLFGQAEEYSVDMHLQNMAECLGPFSLRMLEACKHRSEYFKEDGSLQRATGFMSLNLEEILAGFNTIDSADVHDVSMFLRRCLALDPANRATALELLNDPWLKNVIVE